MARSVAIREEFRQLEAASRPPLDQPVDLDQVVQFLTVMARLSVQPPADRPLVTYSRVLL